MSGLKILLHVGNWVCMNGDGSDVYVINGSATHTHINTINTINV